MTSVAYPYSRAWSANYAHINGGVSSSGGVGHGTNLLSPQFIKITDGVDISLGSGGCFIIGGNTDEIWSFASANFGHSQILIYNTALNTFKGFFDDTNSPLPAGFTVKALFYDYVGTQWWVGLSNGGIYVFHINTSTWEQVNFTSVFPVGTLINNNSITGDTDGNIYIGSTGGLVIYDRSKGSINSESSYYRFTVSDGLPSSNVKAVCIDGQKKRLILATDNGIAFRYNLCKSCVADPISSVKAGNWADPSIWSNNTVPNANSTVIIKHPIVVNINATCKLLYLYASGTVDILSGYILNILNQ